ncbi:MAG: DEAD/DEAH box helicase [Synergistaceae bacterium]|jgi:SNF2 family DNA or RNA helicase|nr:DEAD/DEAH box helicase [Synergistaceae bacterium]
MIFLHGTFVGPELAIWAETNKVEGEGAPVRGKPPRPHPWDLGADGVRSALDGISPFFKRLAEEGALRPAKFIALLPTVKGLPLPSSPLLAERHEQDAADFIQWIVEGLFVDISRVAEFLTSLEPGMVGETARGVKIMADLAFCVCLGRFVGALVARGNFLPGLRRDKWNHEGKIYKGAKKSGKKIIFRGVWEPFLAGMEQERRETFIRSVPGLCRALFPYDSASRKPSLSPLSRRAFVTDAVYLLTDQIVRMSAPPLCSQAAPGGGKNVHQEWVSQLLFADAAPSEKLGEIEPQIKNWRRPVMTTASAPYRFCLQLEESIGTDDIKQYNPDEAQSLFREISEDTEAAWFLAYYVQPVDDPSLLVGIGEILEEPQEETGVKTDERLKLIKREGYSIREFVLTALGQAGRLCPAVFRSLRSPAPTGAEVSSQETLLFLEEQAGALADAGFIVRLPSWWTARGFRKLFRLKARVESKTSAMSASASLSMESLIKVKWAVMLGDDELSLDELKRLASMKNSLVRFRGRWTVLSQDELQSALDFLKHAPKSMSAMDFAGTVLDARKAPLALEKMEGDGPLLDMLKTLTQGQDFGEKSQPEGLEASLRPYQIRGFSWLSFLARWKLGACLADDMGLGKTIQTLSLLLDRKSEGEERPALLVAPTSVLENWRREAERFAPSIDVMVHHGPERLTGNAFKDAASRCAIVATSYAVVARDAQDMSRVQWSGLIVDEAQNIKNYNTQAAKSIRSISADYRIALTGTPVENHVGDLWSLMEFLNPGLLGSQASFKRDFFTPIQKERDTAAASRLRKITSPFLLRRLKTDKDIIEDLPDKVITRTFCKLKREQVTLYAAVAAEAERILEEAEGIKRQGLVLSTMTRLKQICNHPAQFLGEPSAASGVSAGNRSGKLERLYEITDEILSESANADSDRMLVFTQYAEMGEILKRCLQERFAEEVFFLHGGVSKARRDAMVTRFQEDESAPRIFVLSIKAGGTGLNLTRANHVVLFDRWWNPAVEAQAVDRAFRIGQKKNVLVHAFICQGTIEEKIDEMIESKKDIAGMTVGTGESWLAKLSTDELRDLLTLRETAVE